MHRTCSNLSYRSKHQLKLSITAGCHKIMWRLKHKTYIDSPHFRHLDVNFFFSPYLDVDFCIFPSLVSALPWSLFAKVSFWYFFSMKKYKSIYLIESDEHHKKRLLQPPFWRQRKGQFLSYKSLSSLWALWPVRNQTIKDWFVTRQSRAFLGHYLFNV